MYATRGCSTAQHRHDALGGSERSGSADTGRSCPGIGELSRPPNLRASSSARGTSSCRSRLLSSSAAAAKQTAGEWVFNLRRKSAQCQVRWGTATHTKAKHANVAAAVCSIGAGGGDQRSAAAQLQLALVFVGIVHVDLILDSDLQPRLVCSRTPNACTMNRSCPSGDGWHTRSASASRPARVGG